MQRLSIKHCGIIAKRYIYHGPPPFARPPGKQRSRFGKLVFYLSPLIVAGGAATYTHYHEEFRHQLINSMLKCTLDEKLFEQVNKLHLGTSSKATETSENPKFIGPLTQEQRVLELEKDVEQHAVLAIKEFKKATDLLKSFSEDVNRVVDETISKVDPSVLADLKNKIDLRKTAISRAVNTASEALNKISECEENLSLIPVDVGKNFKMVRLHHKLKVISAYITKTKNELLKRQNKGQNCWRDVEKTCNHSKNEMAEKSKNVSQADFEEFLRQAYGHALLHRIEMEHLKSQDDKKLMTQLDYELELERRILLDAHNEETEKLKQHKTDEQMVAKDYWEQHKWIFEK